jgi:hypothetical protein
MGMLSSNSRHAILEPAGSTAWVARVRVLFAFVVMALLAIVAVPAIACQDTDWHVHRLDDPDKRVDGKSLYLFGPPATFGGSIDWYYNDSGRPPAFLKASVIADLQAATAKWTNVCAVPYAYQGETSIAIGAGAGGHDQVNVVGWGPLGANITGQTTTYINGSNALIDSDVTLNPTYVKDDPTLAYTSVHEFGHALGLAHSNVVAQVMSGPAGSGNPGVPATTYTGLATLQPDDIQGCMCLYGHGPSTANQGYLCRDPTDPSSLPSFKDFGSVASGSSSSPFTVTLTNNASSGNVTIQGISTTDAAFVSTVGAAGTCATGKVLAPGGSCTFDLTFSPTGPAGSHNGKFVQIATSVLGPYKFPVTGIATAPAGPALSISTTSVVFGNVNVGSTSAMHTVTLSNSGNAGTVNVTNLALAGANVGDFNRAGTCSIGTALGAGQGCTLQMTFSPSATGSRTATLNVTTDLGSKAVALSGNGTTPPVNPVFSLSSGSIVFSGQTVGSASATQSVSISNVGGGTLTLASLTLGGANPGDFVRTGSCSAGSNLAGGQACTATFQFVPTAAGARAASVTIADNAPGSPHSLTLSGTGFAGGPGGGALNVVEFYHEVFDHYFISINAQEISDLDTGVHPGWMRTGYTFRAHPAATAGNNPVCRFYIPPALGDSHFFSASPQECSDTHAKFPALDYEAPNVFYIGLPDAATGACPVNTVPVYRVWNNRADSNHRYTTSIAIRDQMVARGGIAEGYGPNNVIMCAAP